MNILIITQLYPQPDDKGDNKPTRTVEYFAKEWVKMGHNVIVMHCSSKFPLVYHVLAYPIKNILAGRSSNIIPNIKSRKHLNRKELGIKIYRLPMLKLFPGFGYSKHKMINQSRVIMEILKANNFLPNIVLGHFANPSAELVSILDKNYGVKSSIVFHNDCNEKNIRRYRLNSFIKDIGVIGARSSIEAEEVKLKLNLEYTPFICYSGAPNDAVNSAEKTCQKHEYTNGRKFIYVGSLIKRKNVDAVIKGFVNYSKKNDTLKIVGGGPEGKNLKALTVELGAEDKVIFTGRISRKEVLNQMKEAHIFTLISDGEAYGMVYIEAMLQGCLVIASKGGGFDGLIQNGENGFICNPSDIDMLGSIYLQIDSMTEKERNSIGQRAIDTAINYSEKLVADRYLSEILQRNLEV